MCTLHIQQALYTVVQAHAVAAAGSTSVSYRAISSHCMHESFLLCICSTVRHFICCCIKSPLSAYSPEWFLMHYSRNHECTEFLIIALCVYAVYNVHNSIRHGFDFNSLDFNGKMKCLHRVLMQISMKIHRTAANRSIFQQLSSTSFLNHVP